MECISAMNIDTIERVEELVAQGESSRGGSRSPLGSWIGAWRLYVPSLMGRVVSCVLYKSGVLENWGRGIELMISECRRVGVPDPELHTNGTAVWVVFRYKDETKSDDPTVTSQLRHSYVTVTSQLKQLVDIIGNYTLSTKDILKSVGLRNKTHLLQKYIYPAIELGLVEATHPESPKHPHQKYRLTEKGRTLLAQGE